MNQSLYSRRPAALWGGLLLLLFLPVFTALGFWQWQKAQEKFAHQAELEARSQNAPAAMPMRLAAGAAGLRYRRFALAGEYDAAHQILIDNRTYRGEAGYHVVTPLRLAGSDLHVLVNRGWVPAPAERDHLPEFPPPPGPLRVTGIAVVPAERFFTLGAPPPAGWEGVWQNLDLERFRGGVTYPLQPIVIELDSGAPGGYVRDWPRPDGGAERNLGYAVQWWGLAVASLGLWLYFLLRRPVNVALDLQGEASNRA